MMWFTRAWGWLRDHSWLVAIIGGCLVVLIIAIVIRNSIMAENMLKKIASERELVQEKGNVRKAVAEKDKVVAVQEVKEKHKVRIEKMDQADKEKVNELEDDPEALVDFIMRSSA